MRCSEPEDAPTRVILEWLRESSKTIESMQPGTGYSDLEPFREVFAKTKIVALGEATHGTREFFQFKHRMVQFLVEKMGFRVFAIEAGYIPCLDIGDYVLYGRGDAEKALASQGYFCWDTEEVRAMVNWMRDYNLRCDHGHECNFVGYDIKPVRKGMDYLSAYIVRVLPEFIDVLDDGFSFMQKLDLYKTHADADSRMFALKSLYGVLGALGARREACIAATSSVEYFSALEYLRNVIQLLDSFVTRDNGDSGSLSLSVVKRDLHMAENIERIVNRYPADTRFILWAHNAHIEVNRSWGGIAGAPSMGALLRDRFGSDYYSLGFTFGQGSFQAREMHKGSSLPGRLQSFELSEAPVGHVEWYMTSARPGSYFVDLRSAPTSGAVSAWMTKPHPMRRIGAGFSRQWLPGEYSYDVQIGTCYDGLIHVANTTRAVPNPSGEREEGQSGALI